MVIIGKCRCNVRTTDLSSYALRIKIIRQMAVPEGLSVSAILVSDAMVSSCQSLIVAETL